MRVVIMLLIMFFFFFMAIVLVGLAVPDSGDTLGETLTNGLRMLVEYFSGSES
ncbi:MAG: hypothetical protein AAGE80_03065 [Pseudomonadota bacterium]